MEKREKQRVGGVYLLTGWTQVGWKQVSCRRMLLLNLFSSSSSNLAQDRHGQRVIQRRGTKRRRVEMGGGGGGGALTFSQTRCIMEGGRPKPF